MKFNTVIIGGGLSGLISGIRLAEQGQKCAIISSGQSALHFFSGSFDLLNNFPDGKEINNPAGAIYYLKQQAPEHPYAKLGETLFSEYVKKAENFFSKIGLKFIGNSNNNHYRVTPMGGMRPTWLTASDFISTQKIDVFPWKSVTVFNIEGFLDFQPNYLKEGLEVLGVQTSVEYFNLPDLDRVRKNPSEFRSINLARVLDEPQNIEEIAKIFKEKSIASEIIIMPACIGLEDDSLIKKLSKKVGKPIFLVPTLPPSLVGIRIQKYLVEYFKKLGGVYLLGDNAIGGEIKDNKILKVYTQNHGDIPFLADNVILSSGSFFSQGLIADREKVFEPVFGLEVDYLQGRENWYDSNLFEAQKYQTFGVKTNENFKAKKDGKTIDNLYACGAVLNGFNALKEGCGAGVSILSALFVADQIVIKQPSHELIK